MELADRMLLSAEDITAADTAPRPKKDTKAGVKYWSTIGRIMVFSAGVNGQGPVYSVSFQAENKNRTRIEFAFPRHACQNRKKNEGTAS